jgi:hypothetical protein
MRYRFREKQMHKGDITEGIAVKALACIVFLMHAAWIIGHLYLVNKDAINPWKLGGYGMYTVPFPRALTHVYVFDESQQRWSEVLRARKAFNSYLFDSRNNLHVFRCRPITEHSLVGFFDENQHLRYRPLTVAISEVGFKREEAAPVRKILTSIEIAWDSEKKFGYRGQACGVRFGGTVSYTAP